MLADDPNRFGIPFDSRGARREMTVGKFVIIVHGPNMATRAETSHMIAICVKAALRPADVATIESFSNFSHTGGILIARIIRDDNFPRLNIL
jgi:hypothetical protein